MQSGRWARALLGAGVALALLAGGGGLVPGGRAAARPPQAISMTETPPTATPGPAPELRLPADNSTLPQPVAPGGWDFRWRGPRCGHTLVIEGPQGQRIASPQMGGSGPPPSSFSYVYRADAPLPPVALGPWRWHIDYDCGTYRGSSETRIFWVRGGEIAK